MKYIMSGVAAGMRLRLLVNFCLTLIAGIQGKSIRIVGGEDAAISEFPHLVSLRYWKENTHFCGGSIVSKWHVLTAAHCMSPLQEEYHEVKIYAGLTSSISTRGDSFDIDDVLIYPKFVGIKTEEAMDHHDIAMITVSEPIFFNDYQKQIQLPTTRLPENAIGMLSGWGQTASGGSTSEILQKVAMRVYSNSHCSKHVPFVLKNEQFCAFHSMGVGGCIGDSGSPLTMGGTIVGIISFTAPCAQGYPDIYTDIYSYLNFIKSYMRNKGI